MLTRRLTGPALEPLSLAEAKLHLRVSGPDEDALIQTLIRSARETIERETGLILIDQGWRLILDGWPPSSVIRVPLRPLKTLDAVRILNADAVPSALAVTLFDVAPVACAIRLKSRPADPLRPLSGIELDVTIGHGLPADIPAALIQAIQMMVAFWFENRGDAQLPIGLPESVLRLIAPFRAPRLAP
jgi:uncharacterized phiE125 gp8 family phage protein